MIAGLAGSGLATAHGQASNDQCTGAIGVGEGVFPFDNFTSVVDGPTSCDPDLSGDVWFFYTPTNDGVVSIATCGSVGALDDTVLIIYDAAAGCPTPATVALACDDDGCGIFGFHAEVELTVVAGEPLYVQVGGWNGLIGDGVVTIEALESDCSDGLDDDLDGLIDCFDPDCVASPACPAPNDECATATAVGEGTFPFDNSSTPVTGPTDCEPDLTGDVWFFYSASQSGVVSISTCAGAGALFDTTLIVYDGAGGCPIGGAVAVACDDDSCGPIGLAAEVELAVGAGDTLFIQVGGRNGSLGDAGLTIEFLEGDCADGLDGDGDGLIDCADLDCDLDPACFELDCGDGFDGDGDGLVDCADSDCVGFPGCQEFLNCNDGIDNDLDGATDCADSECFLAPTCAVIPPNDECSGALLIGEGAFPFTNAVAPVTGPNDCDSDLTDDLWYLYTATIDGTLAIGTCATNPATTLVDTVLIVYDGAAGCPLPGSGFVACDDDSCGLLGFDARVEIPVVSGQELLVQVGGWNGTVGDGVLTVEFIETGCFDGVDGDLDGLIDCADSDCAIACDEGANCSDGIDNDGDGDFDCLDADCAFDLACVPVAPNDTCPGAILVGEGLFPFVNLYAPITGPTDCEPNTSGDVWFLYTSAADQVVRIGTCASNGTLADTTVTVYDASLGCPVSPAPALACADDGCGPFGLHASVDLAVSTGDTLFIQVGGWNGQTGDGTLSIEPVIPPATNLSCLDNGIDAIEVAWTPGSGIPPLVAQEVFLDGVLVATLSATDASVMVPYPPGFTGLATVCIVGVAGGGDADPVCCTLPIGGPGNDSCAGAIPVGLGDVPFDNTLATDSLIGSCDPDSTIDLWYTFTSPITGNVSIGTCPSPGGLFDTVVTVYDGATGCPAPADPGIACDDDSCGPAGLSAEVVVAVTTGDTLLIQVAGWNGMTGAGVLRLEEECGGLGTVTCAYDLLSDTMTIDWTDNVNALGGYTVLENGVVVGMVTGGASSLSFTGPAVGVNTYTVEWTCSLTGQAGDLGACTVNVVPPIPTDATAVIIANEGLFGPVGQNDSAAALEAALVANGETVHRFTADDFDTLGLDFSAVSSIWLCLGSFPFDDRLTASEGDLLATWNAAGTAIYLEAADHWGFAHVPSGFDDRDGHDNAIELDGDDSLDQMLAGSPGTVVDLAAIFPNPIPYTRDQPLEFTDRLVPAVADLEVDEVSVVWTQVGQGYITALHATHTFGAPSLIQSWEFGGFPAGDRDLLAGVYRELLELADDPPLPTFERGNCNADAIFNIADAIFLLATLFPGPGVFNDPDCDEACDANDDDNLNIADAVFMLAVLFPPVGGGQTMPPPIACGVDPTAAGATPLECASFALCAP